MGSSENAPKTKVSTGDAGYVLEDVPHFIDYIHDLPVHPLFLNLFYHYTYLCVSWVLLVLIYFFICLMLFECWFEY